MKKDLDVKIVESAPIPDGTKKAPCYPTTDRPNPGAVDISLYLNAESSAS